MRFPRSTDNIKHSWMPLAVVMASSSSVAALTGKLWGGWPMMASIALIFALSLAWMAPLFKAAWAELNEMLEPQVMIILDKIGMKL